MRNIDLSPHLDNVGTSTATATAVGRFNVWGNSFAAEELPAPGTAVLVDAVPFTMPPVGTSEPDNVRCAGQYIEVGAEPGPISAGPSSCEASFAGCWTRGICRACLWGLSRPVPHLGVYPGGGFSTFDDHRVEVAGYRGAETITDQDRVDLFRKAFGLLHPCAVNGQAARDLITAVLATR